MRIALGHPYTNEEICRITAGAGGTPNRIYTHLTTDSREIEPGDIFIALLGEQDDGQNYIAHAQEQGAGVCISSSACTLKQGVLAVEDTYSALVSLAKDTRMRINPIVIAITGSVGKTSTKDMTASILSTAFTVHKTHGNFNNLLGVCLTLLSMPKSTEILVCELGMNHSGEISTLSDIIAPDIAVITNIGHAHIGNLGSRENIATAKKEIFIGCKTGALYLYPAGEPLLFPPPHFPALSIGVARYADCHIKNVKSHNVYIEATFDCHNTPYHVQIPGNGTYVAENAAFAIAIAHTFNISESKIQKGLTITQTSALRGQQITVNNITIIADCYNASPESVKSALYSLSVMYCKGRKMALLGDMLELGSESGKLHTEIGHMCCTANIDYLFTFGAAAQNIANGALTGGMPSTNIMQNPCPSAHKKSAEQIMRVIKPGDILLVKASRVLEAERIITLIQDAIEKQERI